MKQLKDVLLANLQISFSPNILRKLSSVSEHLYSIVDTESYRSALQSLFTPEDFEWSFLKDTKTPFQGEITSVDFHVYSEENIKLIEFSIFPPGPVGTGDQFFSKNEFFDPQEYREKFFQIFGPFQNIAITDNNILQQKWLFQFEDIKNHLKSKGKKVFLLEPSQIQEKEGNLYFKNTEIEYVFNRLTFAEVEENSKKYLQFAHLQQKYPQKFCTPFREWCFSDKSSFVLFSDERYLSTLPKKEKKMLQEIIPKTYFLSDFQNLQEVKTLFPDFNKVVLKPLNSFGGKNIILQPSEEEVQEVITESAHHEILLQEFLPPPKLENGQKYEVRIVLFHGKAFGIMVRAFSHWIGDIWEEGSGYAVVN